MRVRGTQSFVQTVGYCWMHPSLVALEVAWRWLFGIPSLALLYFVGSRILAAHPLAQTGIYDFSLNDLDQAEVTLANVWETLSPPLMHAIGWLAPLLIVGWSIASGLGRSFVLRRYDSSLPFRPATLIVLQLLRVIALAACFAGWFRSIQWAANYSLGSPGAEHEPNLVLYSALVICLSLGIFSLWSLVSWVLSVAPLLALLEGKSAGQSLLRGLRLGRVNTKLVEVNMVLGIVKLGLIVLAMVLSACPLPFESVMTGPALHAWWVFVTLLYLAASDLFQVARLVAFVEFWRVEAEANKSAVGGR
jgi:hypothetical protein